MSDIGNINTRTVRRKAIQEVQCNECERSILAGEIYEYEYGSADGMEVNWITCINCAVKSYDEDV